MIETEHPYYIRNRNILSRIRDVCNGDVKQIKYLPTIDGFKSVDYENLLKTSHFFPATQRTLQAFVGMMFRKSPILTCSDSLLEILDTLDYEKRPFEVFVHNIVYNICQVGNHCCFLDYPVNDKIRSKLESDKLLPVIKDIPIEQIINWHYDVNSNLEFVVIKSDYLKRNGLQHDIVECYILLEMVEGVYTKTVYTNLDGNWLIETGVPTIKGKQLDYIPFFSFRNLDKPIDSILIPLIDANLAHFLLSALKDHFFIKVLLPTPYLFGNVELPVNSQGQKYLPIGPYSAITSQDPDTKIGFLSYSGTGIESIINSINSIRDEMAALGSRALSADKRAVETAEVAKIHRIGEHATLSSVAIRCSNFIKILLDQINKWVFSSDEDINYELTTDFIPESIDGTLLTAIVNAWMNNAISLENVFTFLQQAEFLEREINFKDFLKILEEEKAKKQEESKEAQKLFIQTSKELSDNTDETSIDKEEDTKEEDTKEEGTKKDKKK